MSVLDVPDLDDRSSFESPCSEAENTTHRTKRRRLRVGVIAADRPWRNDLVSYATEHIGSLRVTVVRDPVLLDLGHFDVVVIDDTVPFVANILPALEAADLAVVAIQEANGASEHALESAGVRADRVLESTADVATVAETILECGPDVGVEPIDDRRTMRTASTDADDTAQSTVISNLVAIVGVDAAGGCELAGGLAQGFSRSVQTLLLDLGRPPLATIRFGLQLQPNLGDAARALSVDEAADLVKFTAWRGVSNVQLPFWTLTGAPERADRDTSGIAATGLAPAEADAILQRSGAIFPVQIALVGSSRVDDVAMVTLAQAAHVVVVCEPTPTGVAQLLSWAADMTAVDDNEPAAPAEASGAAGSFRLRRPIEVVLVGSAGRSARAQVVTEIVDALGDRLVDIPRFIPLGDRQRRRAAWRAEVPAGRFRLSCRRFARDLMLDAEVGRDLFVPELLPDEETHDADADDEVQR